jgi:hypothetical protein
MNEGISVTDQQPPDDASGRRYGDDSAGGSEYPTYPPPGDGNEYGAPPPSPPGGGNPYGGAAYPPPSGGNQYGGAGYPPPPPPGYGYGYGYGPTPQAGTNGKAIAALVLGIVGLVFCVLAGIVAIVLGGQARREVTQTGQSGYGMALAGVVMGWVSVGLTVLLVALFAVGAFSAGSSGSLQG